MTEQTPAYTVHSASVGHVGRSINTIRQHHLIIDSPSVNEEMTSSEAFLAGVSSCGVTLIERAAQETGIRLDRIEVTIEAYRHPEIVAFERLAMAFRLTGPSREEADLLVGRYKDG